MSELRVKKAKPLGKAEIRVPGDRNITLRALIFGSLANGPCQIDGFLVSDDTLAAVEALRSLGIRIDFLNDDGVVDQDEARPSSVVVHGRHGVFDPSPEPIDCGGSILTLSLLAGILSAQPFDSVLGGDNHLDSRSLSNLIEPIEKMGAKIESMGGSGRPPLLIRGTAPKPIQHQLRFPDSATKGAILLAGLYAPGKTTVVETHPSHDHTERMLSYFQVKTLSEGNHVSVYGIQIPESRPFLVPGDLTSAAYWIVGGAATPGCELTLCDVGLNPTRTGILKVLVNMGARISESDHGDHTGEPIGDIVVRGRGLRGVKVAGSEVSGMIDELPILAVAGALGQGRTIIRDAGELKHGRTDRIAALVHNFNALGVDVVEHPDGLELEGGRDLKGSRLQSFSDDRIAMAFAIAGLFAEGETVIDDVDCISISYPEFIDHLRAFAGHKPRTTEKKGGLLDRLRKGS